MFILFFLIGCERPSWFITIYDRDYYEAALLRWEDNDGDGQTEVKGDCDDTAAASIPTATPPPAVIVTTKTPPATNARSGFAA